MVQVMNRVKMILIALALLLVTPAAVAEIYKCDGPDGPIYSDQKCGPDAASVEVLDTSGLTGVSDETKAELAARKAKREQAREEQRKLNSNRTVINNQYTTISPQPYGNWYRRPYLRPKPERPEIQPLPGISPPSTIGRPRK